MAKSKKKAPSRKKKAGAAKRKVKKAPKRRKFRTGDDGPSGPPH